MEKMVKSAVLWEKNAQKLVPIFEISKKKRNKKKR